MWWRGTKRKKNKPLTLLNARNWIGLDIYWLTKSDYTVNQPWDLFYPTSCAQSMMNTCFMSCLNRRSSVQTTLIKFLFTFSHFEKKITETDQPLGIRSIIKCNEINKRTGLFIHCHIFFKFQTNVNNFKKKGKEKQNRNQCITMNE